jgi:diaminopimelate epimerase
MELIRMSAAGNAFYLSAAAAPAPADAELRDLARRISRGEGLRDATGSPSPPSDGLILYGRRPPSQRMFNPDGSEGLCANGLRCLARLLVERGELETGGSVRTVDGPKRVWVRGAWVEAELGPARPLAGRGDSLTLPFGVQLGDERIEGYGVDLGNPHFVILTDRATQARLDLLGPALSTHPAFPAGANIEMAVAEGDGYAVRVWERGAGETPSCGTGALALAAVGPRALQPGQSLRVAYPGGPLEVRMDTQGRLLLAGEVRHEGTHCLGPAGSPAGGAEGEAPR